jgi:phage head maturation protease
MRHDRLLPDTLRRSATPRPASFDEAALTVEAVVATAEPVARRDARGPFLEVLDMGTLDLTRAKGAAVLDNHRTGSARDAVGIVEDVRIEDGVALARLRFSRADDVAPIIARVQDGTLLGVSVGYRVAGWREGTDAQRRRTKSPSAWAITEVSLTPNPADPNARIRSQQEGHDMEPDTITPAAPDEAERTRRSEIRALVRAAGLDVQTADDLIDAGADLTRAKAEVFDATQAKRRAQPIIRSDAPANDDPATFVRRATDALAFRAAGGDLPEDARPLVNMTLRDVAAESLARAGASVRGLSTDEIITRSATHTTSDFPLIVSNVASKVALDAYRAAESPLKTLARQRTLPNFKPSTALRLGELGRLEEISENGEITHTTAAEAGESLQLSTFARGLNVSRKLLIDDDLGLLGDMAGALGRAAAQTEADLMVGLLTGNPKLSDGKAVFHATRGNIGDASAVTTAAIAATRLNMRLRTSLDGKTIISATPRYLVVPADLETEAEARAGADPADQDRGREPLQRQALAARGAASAGRHVVPLRWTRLALAVRCSTPTSPRRRACRFSGPRRGTRSGMKFRAFLDFGAGWLDWRGAHKVPGL